MSHIIPASLLDVSKKLQIDVCDGDFVRAQTWPFTELHGTYKFLELKDGFEQYLKPLQQELSPFEIELDLMVSDADQLCALWDFFHPDHVIFHLNSLTGHEWLAQQFGLATNGYSWLRPEKTIFAFSFDTDPDLFKYFYDFFGCRKVQVMGIKTIGKQGELLDPHVFTLIKNLTILYPGIEIQVDGGVNETNIAQLREAGVTKFVCGSAVFNGDPKTNIEKLKSLIQ